MSARAGGRAGRGRKKETAMTIEPIMTRDVETCAPDSDLAHAAMIMWRRDCGFVPVAEHKSGRYVGVITDRDICMAGATCHRALHDIRVGEVMNKGTYTCAPTDNVLVALHRLAEGQVRRLPVVDKQGKVVGVLSLNDLILACERGDRKREGSLTYADVMAVLKAISSHRLPVPVIA
jgi:CBS domain-containing protein